MQRVAGEVGARGCCLRLLRTAPSRQQPALRGSRSVTVAVGWDPENVLAGPQEGHIARRQCVPRVAPPASGPARSRARFRYQKKVMKDAAFLQQEERRLAKAQVELEAKRESRAVPEGNPKAMVEFLLNTPAEEMPFEVARCRPHLVRRWGALARRPPVLLVGRRTQPSSRT